MLHTLLRRRAGGQPIENIRKDLIIPTCKRRGQNPSPASAPIAVAEHDSAQRRPEAITQAHNDFTALTT